MDFVQLKFKTLRLIISLTTSALIALAASKLADTQWIIAFGILTLGFPAIVFLEKLKVIPGHLVAAYIMNKEFVREAKKKLKKLPLKTAEEWQEFEDFYDNDRFISEYVNSDPKTFAVATRYSLQTMRECGRFMDYMNCGLIQSKAIEQIFWETAENQSD